MSAELALRSPLGRTLAYRAQARAGADGIARLRVPHPTRAADAPVHAAGAWRVRAGGREWRLALSLDEVREGARVDVAARAAGAARPEAPAGL